MSGEKIFQKEGTTSAKVLGQRHTGAFETAPREHGWCGTGEGRVRGEGRRVFMQRLWRLAELLSLYCECREKPLESFELRGDLDT